ncbi:MAG: HPr family phosphocarrier protein [Alphaproteobacteria bacterium]|nr:HPr family phosphocarrier protein [Alphaproteobacteria bacterium]
MNAENLHNQLCSMVVIENERGLHARAAAKFVRTVEMFQSHITVARGDTRVSGHSIMSLMMLAATRGTPLQLCASGLDAPTALTALEDLVRRKFDED